MTDLSDIAIMYKLLLFFVCLLPVIGFAQTPDLNETIELLSVEDYETQEVAIGNLYRFLESDFKAVQAKEKEIQVSMMNGLNSSDPNIGLYHLLLDLVTNKVIQLNEPIKKKIVTTYSIEKIDLRRLQTEDYSTSIWEDDNYLHRRFHIGLLLDLMGYLDDNNSLEELKEAVSMYDDKKMRLFASCSLIKRGQPVSSDILESIAEDPESRIYLFDYLKKEKKINLFPKPFLNQASFAESEMVNWLLYSTELGRMPDDISFLKMYKIKFKSWGKVGFYLWRFRSDHEDWKDKGWMVGVSGPYQFRKMPTTESLGFTFSNFTPLRKHAYDNHFKNIIETVIEFKRNNN